MNISASKNAVGNAIGGLSVGETEEPKCMSSLHCVVKIYRKDKASLFNGGRNALEYFRSDRPRSGYV